MIRQLMKGIVNLTLFPIFLTIFLFLHILHWFKLLLSILKSFCSIGKRRQTQFSPIDSECKAAGVFKVTTAEALDFGKHRASCYFSRLTLYLAHELSRFFVRGQRVDLISDRQLAYVVLSTVYAHSVEWDGERAMFRLKMTGISCLVLHPDFFYEAREILVSRDARKIVIVMSDGKEYSSDDVDNRHLYERAKLHAQVCLTYYAPGLAHNHVHFVLPSTMAAMSKRLLDRNGLLYQLLSPHFRFTEAINQQALRVNKATDNRRTFVDRFFFLWKPFPLGKQQFVRQIAEKCTRHYYQSGTVPHQQEQAEGSNISGSSEEEEDVGRNRTHPIFPPHFVDKKRAISKIPYMRFLRKYYVVVRRFVESVAPFIDRDEWKKLSEAVSENVPRFDEVDMIDAIATFIHQVGIVHFADHHTYLNFFSTTYGCGAVRSPFVTDDDLLAEPLKRHRPSLTIAEARRNPALLLRQRDVLRTRCFLNVFVEFIPGWTCDMQLVNTKYKFGQNGTAQQAAQRFIRDLRITDEKLKNTNAGIEIERLPGETRADGLQLVKLDSLVRSVCY